MLQNNEEGGNDKKGCSSLAELLMLVAVDFANSWERKTYFEINIFEKIFCLTPRTHTGSAGVTRWRCSDPCYPRSRCPPYRTAVASCRVAGESVDGVKASYLRSASPCFKRPDSGWIYFQEFQSKMNNSADTSGLGTCKFNPVLVDVRAQSKPTTDRDTADAGPISWS